MEQTRCSTFRQSGAEEDTGDGFLNVLVVDDQPSVLKIVRKMLYDLNCFKVIESADNGENAWSKIKQRRANQYDIVITDIYMPELDGIGLITRCRKSMFARDMPFMVITGETNPKILAALGEMGVRDCLVKPFSFQIFQDRIISLLQRIKDPLEKSYGEISHLIESGSFDEASARLEGLNKDESEKPRWLNLKGEILLGMGDLERARECIEQALTFCDCYLTALCNQAELEEKSANPEAAVKSLEKADAISPLMVDRKINLGNLLFDLDRGEDAKKILCKAASITHDCEIKLQITEMLNAKGYGKDADKIIKRILIHKNINVETYNKIGISQRKQCKYKDAEMSYMAALNYFPNNAAIQYNLGILYLYQSNTLNACESFRKSLYYDPEFRDAHDMLDYYCSQREPGEMPAVKPCTRERYEI